jgi:hypothetical protein
MIQAGDFGDLLAIHFYEETPLTSKHLVVAYQETNSADSFIVTAYLAGRPSSQKRIVSTFGGGFLIDRLHHAN